MKNSNETAEVLRSLSIAYPEDAFPNPTEEDRKNHAALIAKASAQMGRHLSQFMILAADEIDRIARQKNELEQEVAMLNETIKSIQNHGMEEITRLGTELKTMSNARKQIADTFIALRDAVRGVFDDAMQINQHMVAIRLKTALELYGDTKNEAHGPTSERIMRHYYGASGYVRKSGNDK